MSLQLAQWWHLFSKLQTFIEPDRGRSRRRKLHQHSRRLPNKALPLHRELLVPRMPRNLSSSRSNSSNYNNSCNSCNNCSNCSSNICNSICNIRCDQRVPHLAKLRPSTSKIAAKSSGASVQEPASTQAAGSASAKGPKRWQESKRADCTEYAQCQSCRCSKCRARCKIAPPCIESANPEWETAITVIQRGQGQEWQEEREGSGERCSPQRRRAVSTSQGSSAQGTSGRRGGTKTWGATAGERGRAAQRGGGQEGQTCCTCTSSYPGRWRYLWQEEGRQSESCPAPAISREERGILQTATSAPSCCATCSATPLREKDPTATTTTASTTTSTTTLAATHLTTSTAPSTSTSSSSPTELNVGRPQPQANCQCGLCRPTRRNSHGTSTASIHSTSTSTRKHGRQGKSHQPSSANRNGPNEDAATSSWNRSWPVVNRTSSRFVTTTCVASSRHFQAKRLDKSGASRSSSCFSRARSGNRQLFWWSSWFGLWWFEWFGRNWLSPRHFSQTTATTTIASTSCKFHPWMPVNAMPEDFYPVPDTTNRLGMFQQEPPASSSLFSSPFGMFGPIGSHSQGLKWWCDIPWDWIMLGSGPIDTHPFSVIWIEKTETTLRENPCFDTNPRISCLFAGIAGPCPKLQCRHQVIQRDLKSNLQPP